MIAWKIRRALCITAAVVLLPAVLHAHGTQIYLSTPFAPPRGWLWVPLVWFACLLVWTWWHAKEQKKLWKLVFTVVRYTIAYSFITLLIGNQFARATSAPPPGLGLFGTPFYGLGWRDVGVRFVVANVVCVVIFIAAMGVMAFRLEIKEHKWPAFVCGCIVIYVLCLAPYIASGAMSHGWHGIYTHLTCFRQFSILAKGLQGYVLEHNGQLPPGRTMEKVYEQVNGYIPPSERSRRMEPLIVCPVEKAQSRRPRPYEWNSRVSGKVLEDLRATSSSVVLFTCPSNHLYTTPALKANMLLSLMERASTNNMTTSSSAPRSAKTTQPRMNANEKQRLQIAP